MVPFAYESPHSRDCEGRGSSCARSARNGERVLSVSEYSATLGGELRSRTTVTGTRQQGWKLQLVSKGDQGGSQWLDLVHSTQKSLRSVQAAGWA